MGMRDMAGRRGWGQWRELRGGVGVFGECRYFALIFALTSVPLWLVGSFGKDWNGVTWRFVE